MTLTLSQFEAIDGLNSQLLYMGDFMTCADPREYVRRSNRLFDACLAAGMPFDEPNHEEWAMLQITNALVSA
jgi:hypothetical protein